jgi:hypothetical protein
LTPSSDERDATPRLEEGEGPTFVIPVFSVRSDADFFVLDPRPELDAFFLPDASCGWTGISSLTEFSIFFVWLVLPIWPFSPEVDGRWAFSELFTPATALGWPDGGWVPDGDFCLTPLSDEMDSSSEL